MIDQFDGILPSNPPISLLPIYFPLLSREAFLDLLRPNQHQQKNELIMNINF